MAIHIPLKDLSPQWKNKIQDDLQVVQIDETFEKMKRRGKILPGYTPDPIASKIVCFDIIGGNIAIPFHYALKYFKDRIPSPDNYPTLPDSIENEVKLRENQEEAALKCFKYIDTIRTVTVGLPPGRGKTYIGAFLVHCFRLKTIVVVPRKTLLEQWETTFSRGLPGASIWIVGENGDNFPPGCDKETPPDVTICLDPRISKIPSYWKNKIGTLIIDEAHMLPTRGRIENLLSLQPCYIIMETATMERGDGLHKICQLIGGIHGIFEVSKIPYQFNIVQLPFIEASERSGFRGVDYNYICNSLSSIKEYNRVILNIVRHNPSNKFIVLTKRVEHGNELQKMFVENDITADTLMGNKKKYTNSRVLIGTFSKIGTGFDEATASKEFEGPTSDSLIICHSVSKISNFEQYRGRVMRTDKTPTVYWLNVKNRIIRNHLTDIKKHVVATNGTIVYQDGIQYMYSKKQ